MEGKLVRCGICGDDNDKELLTQAQDNGRAFTLTQAKLSFGSRHVLVHVHIDICSGS